MKRVLRVLGVSVLLMSAAHAAPGKGEVAVSANKVEQQVSGLAAARRTAGFDAGFKEAVRMIQALSKSDSRTAAVDSQDLALSALHLYMDHKRIDLPSDPEARQAKAREAASEAGLLAVLGW
jgi:hypothetical protein